MTIAEKPSVYQGFEVKKAVSILRVNGVTLRGFDIPQEFLRRSEEDGAAARILTPQGKRNLAILSKYIQDPNSSFESVGEHENLTKERARQIVEGARNHPGMLHELWNQTSAQTQHDFPIETLEKAMIKPHPPKLRPESATVTRIDFLIKEGKSLQEIRKAGFTTAEIGLARRNLKRRGVEIPFLGKPRRQFEQELSKFKKLEDPRTTKKLKQSLLNKIARDRSFDRLQQQGLVRSVLKLADEAGFHVHPRKIAHFLNSLKIAEIPFGKEKHKIKSGSKKNTRQNYYFISASDFEKAKEIWRNDPALQKFLMSGAAEISGWENVIFQTQKKSA